MLCFLKGCGYVVGVVCFVFVYCLFYKCLMVYVGCVLGMLFNDFLLWSGGFWYYNSYFVDFEKVYCCLCVVLVNNCFLNVE